MLGLKIELIDRAWVYRTDDGGTVALRAGEYVMVRVQITNFSLISQADMQSLYISEGQTEPVTGLVLAN